MKDLKSIYQLVIRRLKETTYFDGICTAISETYYAGILTRQEVDLVRDDFEERKPKFYSLTYWTDRYKGNKSAYWWPLDEKGKQTRIKFLENIIKKLK
jgi:hypothetical protein